MHRKLPQILLLSAWLLATGGLWDLVQIGAWTRMFARNLETMPVLEAARNIFRPEEKCSFCSLAESGKRAQENSGTLLGDTLAKAPIVFQSVAGIVVPSPEVARAPRPHSQIARCHREAPPCPPPRGGMA